MFLRLPILLALLLSLVLGPVQWSAACAGPATGEVVCEQCCTEAEMACCAPNERQAPQAPASIAPQAMDGKLIAAPVLFVVAHELLPVVERPSFDRQQAARMPVTPRLDVTCIRLI
jgi:hypothetical protein